MKKILGIIVLFSLMPMNAALARKAEDFYRCGDNVCSPNESCKNCITDCGRCDPICGDDACNGGESCGNCEADCGQCAGGFCSGNGCDIVLGETCVSCPGDCGACVTGEEAKESEESNESQEKNESMQSPAPKQSTSVKNDDAKESDATLEKSVTSISWDDFPAMKKGYDFAKWLLSQGWSLVKLLGDKAVEGYEWAKRYKR